MSTLLRASSCANIKPRCLYCNHARAVSPEGLCRACDRRSSVRCLYRHHRHGWTPAWEEHLKALAERASQGVPLFQDGDPPPPPLQKKTGCIRPEYLPVLRAAVCGHWSVRATAAKLGCSVTLAAGLLRRVRAGEK